jgi:hypothetical protein
MLAVVRWENGDFMKHNKSQGKNDDQYSSGRAVNIGIFIAIVFLVLFVVYLNFRNTDIESEPPTVVFIPSVTPGNQLAPIAVTATPVILPSETSTEIPSATSTSTAVILDSPSFENYYAKVSCREIEKVNLRKTPGHKNKDGAKDDVIIEISCNQFLELLGETRYVDGLTWWKVKWRDYEGWMADHTEKGKIIIVFSKPTSFSQSNPKEFAFWYFNVIWQQRDYENLWENFLTPSFQYHSSSGDFNEYVKWWSSVQRIDNNSIDVLQNNGAIAKIKVDLTFYLADGRTDYFKDGYTLVYDSNAKIWMFDYR